MLTLLPIVLALTQQHRCIKMSRLRQAKQQEQGSQLPMREEENRPSHNSDHK